MSRISPAPPDRLAEFVGDMEKSVKTRGYVPNSWLTLARKPKMFHALRALREAAMADAGETSPALRFMVGEVVSNAAGCRYCAAHNAENAGEKAGVAADKIKALWQFRDNPLFDDAEKTALELALAAGSCPPAVTDEHFTALRKHFSEDAIIELVSVIAFFGFQNRWNDTLATKLEAHPLEFAQEHLASSGWTPGVHGN